MDAHQRLGMLVGGIDDRQVPISLSTLVGLLDGKCPDVEDVIVFYEVYLTHYPKGLATEAKKPAPKACGSKTQEYLISK